jgi:glucose-1-phosphatase
MLPEVVVFDLGKVLLDFDFQIASNNLAARSPLTPAKFNDYLLSSPLLIDYETGLLSNEEFYHGIGRGTGYSGTFEQFAAAFGDIFSPIKEMIQLHEQLRARRIPTYIFSNTSELAVAHVRRTYPFLARFDGYIYSYEHQAMKPNAKLYEVVERVTGRHGGQILYMDDRLENVQAGQARGWQVIHHQTPQQTIATLRRLGMLPAIAQP